LRYIFFTFLILLNIYSPLFSISETYKNNITIDGNTSDFDKESDQIILSPELPGKFYESDSDSKWGSYNDINNIKITWDSGYLYIGIDGIIYNNNMILYFDIDENSGISDVNSINNWKRKIKFKNFTVNFFAATGDNNTSPQFWQVASDGTTTDISDNIKSAATFSGSIKGGMELKIPWTTLYNRGWGEISTNAVLKLVGVVTGGDDSSGPDSAPDSSEEMPVNSSDLATLDNYLIIYLDKNSDGKPDIGVNIRNNCDVAIDITSLKYQPLNIVNINIENQVFTPNNDGINDTTKINYYLTKDAIVNVKVFNLKGDLIYSLQNDISLTKGEQQIEWNGYNNKNVVVSPGLYIIYIKATTMGVSRVKKIAVYVK